MTKRQPNIVVPEFRTSGEITKVTPKLGIGQKKDPVVPLVLLRKAAGGRLSPRSKGEWVPDRGEGGRPWAVFTCPACGRPGRFPPFCQIEGDGRIELQVRCGKGCRMAAYYKLDGWDHGHVVQILTG